MSEDVAINALVLMVGAMWGAAALMLLVLIHDGDNSSDSPLSLRKRPQIRTGERGIVFLFRIGIYLVKIWIVTPFVWVLLFGVMLKDGAVWLVSPQNTNSEVSPDEQ